MNSIRTRIIASSIVSVIRAILSFSTGLIIARDLNPSGYGSLMFLLGSFVAVRSILDLGTSNAFFTFLSQRPRGRKFYLGYFFWLFFQLVLTLLLLLLIIPIKTFEQIWLEHDRLVVSLAFIATFMQYQVWQTISQICESMRMTVKVQMLNIFIAIAYFTAVTILSMIGKLSIFSVLIVIIVQYVLAASISYNIIFHNKSSDAISETQECMIILDYWRYCKPLILLAILNFAYEFADKWMLQQFSGSIQQGYFQISSQFASVSLLASTSIMSVFWKEVAYSWSTNDKKRVHLIYQKVNRGLFMFGAIVTGFLLPWSEYIVKFLLGDNYISAWPVLAVMLFYPIHQSSGQLAGAMFFASGQTYIYTAISIFMMLLSVPASFFVLAPPSGSWLPGLELGALGMAFKMVVLGILSVNIQAWFISKHGGWKYDWVFQIAGIFLTTSLGFLAYSVVFVFWDFSDLSFVQTLMSALCVFIIYSILILITIFSFPALFGVDSILIHSLFIKLNLFFIKVRNELKK